MSPISTVERAVHALAVAHVANEEANPLIAPEQFGHFPLLHLVARIDDELARVVARQRHGHEGVAKRAGTAGDEDGGVVQHGRKGQAGVLQVMGYFDGQRAA